MCQAQQDGKVSFPVGKPPSVFPIDQEAGRLEGWGESGPTGCVHNAWRLSPKVALGGWRGRQASGHVRAWLPPLTASLWARPRGHPVWGRLLGHRYTGGPCGAAPAAGAGAAARLRPESSAHASPPQLCSKSQPWPACGQRGTQMTLGQGMGWKETVPGGGGPGDCECHSDAPETGTED